MELREFMYIKNIRLLVCHPKMKMFYIILLASYSILLILSHFGNPVGNYDESFQMVGSMLVQTGSVPYKDFWAFYTPLNYYMNATAFYILGQSVISARLIQGIFYLLVIVFLLRYFFQRIKFSATFAALIGFLGVIIIGKTFTLVCWNSFALGFLGILMYLQSAISSHKRRMALMLISGFLIALSVFSKLNFGVYFAFGVAADMIRQIVLSRNGTKVKRDTTRRFLRDSFCFILPFVLCSIFFVISYRMCLSEALYQILIYPATIVKDHRIISFKFYLHFRYIIAALMPLIWIGIRSNFISCNNISQITAIWVLVILLLLLIFIGIGVFIPSKWPTLALIIPLATFVSGCLANDLDRTEFIALMTYSLFLHYLFTRADDMHFVVLMPITTLLLPNVVDKWQKYSDNKGIVPMINIRLAVLIMVIVLHWNLSYRQFSVDFERFLPHPLNTIAGIKLLTTDRDLLKYGDSKFLMTTLAPLDHAISRLYSDENELKAARFVYNQTTENEAVYIGEQDHSRSYANNIRIYWILGRKIGVKHYLLEPSLTTEDFIQKEMIKNIQNNGIHWIILTENSVGDKDFQKRGYSGSNRLDRFIKNEFYVVRVFGNYSVLCRHDAQTYNYGSVYF